MRGLERLVVYGALAFFAVAQVVQAKDPPKPAPAKPGEVQVTAQASFHATDARLTGLEEFWAVASGAHQPYIWLQHAAKRADELAADPSNKARAEYVGTGDMLRRKAAILEQRAKAESERLGLPWPPP